MQHVARSNRPANLLTIQEAASRLGVSTYTVRRWALDGTLPEAYKVPTSNGVRLFHPDDVIALAARRDHERQQKAAAS